MGKIKSFCMWKEAVRAVTTVLTQSVNQASHKDRNAIKLAAHRSML